MKRILTFVLLLAACEQAPDTRTPDEICSDAEGYRLGYEGKRVPELCTKETFPSFWNNYADGAAKRAEHPNGINNPEISIGIGYGWGWGSYHHHHRYRHHGFHHGHHRPHHHRR